MHKMEKSKQKAYNFLLDLLVKIIVIEKLGTFSFQQYNNYSKILSAVQKL